MSALGGMTVGELREALADLPDFYVVEVEPETEVPEDCESCAAADLCLEIKSVEVGSVRVVLR